MKAFWDEGKSASQIAALLGGVSRNAVIGKLHRLGLAGRNSTYRKPARPGFSDLKPQSFHRDSWKRTANDTALFRPVPKPPRPSQINCAAKPAVAKYTPGPIGGVTFADLEHGMCKYPLWERLDEAKRFCGSSVLKTDTRTYPYCEHHAAIAYNKWVPTGRSDPFKFGNPEAKKAA